MNQTLHVPDQALRTLCRRWRIQKLALFGSALDASWRADSDVDLLVDFQPDAGWDLMDLILLREELEALFGRPVDLVERRALTNPYRRRSILSRLEVLYAA
jgi:hypothetical protein